MYNKELEKIFIADIYENLGVGEYLVIKDAILYRTTTENTYRIINIEEYDIKISKRIIVHPNNIIILGDYYIKEMKNFLYMNGTEIEKVMKYVR